MLSRDVRQHIGQLAVAGFDGHAVPPELRALAREFDLGGVILFSRNIDRPEQLADLTREAGGLARDRPLWIGVDQEGGRVARLRAPFTEWPPMACLGRSGDARLAARLGRAMADELAAVGINLDFAPVLDLHTNPANRVIGDRALSDRAEVAGRLGAAFVRALQEGGVAACGKHFPGHGDTTTDSHVALPVVEHPPDRLHAVEILPFREAVAAGVAGIMMAHVLVPAVDDRHPATLSSTLVSGWLRGELAHGGLVFTDDLEMRAIRDRYALEDAAVGAIAAGCDQLLLCGVDADAQMRTLEALVHAVEDQRLPIARVEDALKRQRAGKERFLFRDRAVWRAPRDLRRLLGRAEHRALADELARYV